MPRSIPTSRPPAAKIALTALAALTIMMLVLEQWLLAGFLAVVVSLVAITASMRIGREIRSRDTSELSPAARAMLGPLKTQIARLEKIESTVPAQTPLRAIAQDAREEAQRLFDLAFTILQDWDRLKRLQSQLAASTPAPGSPAGRETELTAQLAGMEAGVRDLTQAITNNADCLSAAAADSIRSSFDEQALRSRLLDLAALEPTLAEVKLTLGE